MPDAHLAGDVLTPVDWDHRARDAPGAVTHEEGCKSTDIVDVHDLLQRRICGGAGEQLVDAAIPFAARVPTGPGESACTRMPREPISAARQRTLLSSAAFTGPIRLWCATTRSEP